MNYKQTSKWRFLTWLHWLIMDYKIHMVFEHARIQREKRGQTAMVSKHS